MKQILQCKFSGQAYPLTLDLDDLFMSDRNAIKYTRHYGVCEPELMDVMTRVIKPGDTVVDGGANIGYFSLLMAKLVGEAGRVYAFEPGQNNLDKLRRNVALNEATQVKIIAQPLWRESQLVDLYMAR